MTPTPLRDVRLPRVGGRRPSTRRSKTKRTLRETPGLVVRTSYKNTTLSQRKETNSRVDAGRAISGKNYLLFLDISWVGDETGQWARQRVIRQSSHSFIGSSRRSDRRFIAVSSLCTSNKLRDPYRPSIKTALFAAP